MTLESEEIVKECIGKSKYVYHYTGFETIFALLYGYHKNGSYLSFRASNVYNVNDTCEMERGYEVLKEILPKLEERYQIPVEKRLSEVYNAVKYEDECRRDYLYGKGLCEISHGIIPYVISFSKHKDYLPMWSLYGKQGKGVCLKLDLSELLEKTLDCSCFGWVYYKRNNMMFIEQIVLNMYQLLLNQTSDNTCAESIKSKIFNLGTMCLAVSPFIKHNDYMYEGEFRITANKSYTGNILSFKKPFIENKIGIEPHTNIMIPASVLKEIIIGPDTDYDVMSHVLGTALLECKINPRIITRSKINFKQNK